MVATTRQPYSTAVLGGEAGLGEDAFIAFTAPSRGLPGAGKSAPAANHANVSLVTICLGRTLASNAGVARAARPLASRIAHGAGRIAARFLRRCIFIFRHLRRRGAATWRWARRSVPRWIGLGRRRGRLRGCEADRTEHCKRCCGREEELRFHVSFS